MDGGRSRGRGRGRGGGGGGWGRGRGSSSSGPSSRQRYHGNKLDRTLTPGRTGFLISTTTGPVDRAKRELEALFNEYVDKLGTFTDGADAVPRDNESGSDSDGSGSRSDGDERESSSGPEEATSSSAQGFGGSIAAMLQAELNTVRSAKSAQQDGGAEVGGEARKRPRRLGEGNHFRLMDCFCKGYLFYDVDFPDGKPGLVKDAAAAGKGTDGPEGISCKGDAVEIQMSHRKDGPNPTLADVLAQMGSDDSDDEPLEEGAESATSRKRPREADVAEAHNQAEQAEQQTGLQTTSAPLRSSLEKAVPVDLFRPNPNVLTIAEGLFDNLLQHPQVVARFSYRLVPVVASCNPSLPFIIPLVLKSTADLTIPAGRSAIKTAVTFFVRNNTTVEKEKNLMREKIEKALPMSKFLIVKETSADVLIVIAVVHSTCCIGICRDYSRRMEYNLHKLSEKALQLDALTTRTEKEAPALVAAPGE